MEKLILKAIRSKKKLVFYYDHATRVVDPQYIGQYNSEKVLFGYQTGGFKPLSLPGLAKFPLNRIESPAILNVHQLMHD